MMSNGVRVYTKLMSLAESKLGILVSFCILSHERAKSGVCDECYNQFIRELGKQDWGGCSLY